ncbi:MAG: L-2-hydroxyglutarate oxidase [Sulfuritalea sp.]|nr:L-2-hydroxyglutarate oxidase [Sulfuritalea sp.]
MEVIVVGGGIIGLATALNIMQSRPKTRLVLIEKEKSVAQHQTGRNSGVIHSGLYYKPGSLKAINCRVGYKKMLKFCLDYSIPHDICGKIVVATSKAELPRLDELHRRGVANGLNGLRFLQPNEIGEIEPHCRGLRGLLVPQTGIVDYVEVANKYAELLTNMGAEIVCGETIVDIVRHGNLVEVLGNKNTWTGRVAVVCAGLHSDRLAKKSEPNLPLRILPFRGEYYQFTASAPKLVNHLIYPVPDPAFPFLGVHFTRMVGGGVECGPNAVFALGREAYKKTDLNIRDLCESIAWPGFRTVAKKYWRTGLGEYYRSISKQAFVQALQKLIPDIRAEHLEAGGAGIRAQACDRDGNLIDDFDIRKDHNIIHVCNAPSPAATASLAIGQNISKSVIELLI